MTSADNLKILPLHTLHEQAGAKFGAFAGWNMPITYPAGVMQEHLHTRAAAGLFDISHMKLIAIAGRQAADFLSRALPMDAAALGAGQSRYSFLLNEQAGIIDDLIVTRLGDSHFMMVANAGNADMDIAELQKRLADFDCTVTPLARVLLALQGPQAVNIMRDAGLSGTDLTFMHGMENDKGWFITRSGYTGEDGFEIALPAAEAEALVQKLLADPRVQWTGLAARDSLRLEAGLCLHGQDITMQINPVEAGLTFAVARYVREKADFIGAQAYIAAFAAGAQRRRVGLKPEGRQPVRAGAQLFDAQGNEIGVVTSGGFGPSFNAPVAMGYVSAALDTADTQIFADVRGKKLPVAIHPLPFIPQHYFKG